MKKILSAFSSVGLIAAMGLSNNYFDAHPRYLCAAVVFLCGLIIVFVARFKYLGRKQDVVMFVTLLMLEVMSILACTINHTYANFFYFVSFTVNISAFIFLGYFFSRKDMRWGQNVLFGFLFLIFIVALLQLTYIYSGFGINPTPIQRMDVDVNGALSSALGIRSIFANTNDLGAFCVIAIIWLCYATEFSSNIKILTSIALFVMIVLSGSRGGLIAGSVVIVLFFTKSMKGKAFICITCVALVIALSTPIDVMPKGFQQTYFGRKMATIAKVISAVSDSGVSGVSDDSAHVRLTTYRQFLSRLPNLGLGSWSAQDYDNIITASKLMQTNPHSLMVELGALYGYFGLLAFFSIMYWFFIVSKRWAPMPMRIMLTLCVFVATFESSSIILRSAFWVYLFACGFHNRNVVSAKINKYSLVGDSAL